MGDKMDEQTLQVSMDDNTDNSDLQGKPKIAYFSMEIGIDEHIPTYSGGLGILAGDTIKSCADLNVPVVGVTLLSENGYFYLSPIFRKSPGSYWPWIRRKTVGVRPRIPTDRSVRTGKDHGKA